MENACVVVPWHNRNQLDLFLSAWDLGGSENYLILQQDKHRDGCAVTKNKGVAKAVRRGFEMVVVLDDDCYPDDCRTITQLIEAHLLALEPQPVEIFHTVTTPPSRGTPYLNRTITMPVAASMGFWSHVGDYDAPGQLVHGATHTMQFDTRPIYCRWFPLCGMNLAFRPADWLPWCDFIDVPRFDDIWMGWLWQKEAYRRGFCFNLNGPVVRHSRQSNVWQNLRDEARHLEANDTLWRDIAVAQTNDYHELTKLLPI